MTAPQLDLDWTITPNLRRAYVSLLDLAAWWLYRNKVALVAAGWQVWWTCDGTTGPVDENDHTDRWASEADCDTRASAAGSPLSYCVLKNADGVMLRLLNFGTADGQVHVMFDPTGSLTLATPTTGYPDGTDPGTLVTVSSGTAPCGTTTSTDRVMSIWTSGDRAWRCVCFRQSAVQLGMSVEKVTRLSTAGTFPVPYVGSCFIAFDRSASAVDRPACNSVTNRALGNAAYRGFAGSIFTSGTNRACRMAGMLIQPAAHTVNVNPPTSNVAANIVFDSEKPAALEGLASPTFPIWLCGESTVNYGGIWGVLVDWSQVLTNSTAVPALTDIMAGFDPDDVPGVSGGETGVGDARTNWFVAIGAAALWPWRNAAAVMEIA